MNLTNERRAILQFLGFADGAVDLHDVAVEHDRSWGGAVRTARSLARAGFVDLVDVPHASVTVEITARGRALIGIPLAIGGAA